MENKLTVPTSGDLAREPVRRRPHRLGKVPMRRCWMLLAAVVVAAGVTGGTVASASAAPTRQSGTWIGAIEQHGNHFDYVGRACPTEVEVCVAVEARYRITPITLEARQALPGAAGGPAELEGFLIDHHDRGHAGSLIVHRVESLAPAA